MPFFKKTLAVFCFALWLVGCSKRNYNADAEALVNQPAEERSRFGFLKEKDRKLENASLADTAKPQLAVVADSSLFNDPAKKKKALKKSKKTFLGYEIKKGFTKQGKGKTQTVEIYHYVPKYVEPNPYAPAKYYFNTKAKKIYRTNNIKVNEARTLHGPYKKIVNKQVVTEGYFYFGTQHLRWETYNRNNILTNKTHFEKGFPRDAIVTHYDAAKTKIKEVIPYADEKLNGDYVMFFENGLRAWEGQYEDGKKVGVWTQYWPFRNRKHFDYQYPETAESPPFEPFVLREYDRNNNIIYEKDKIDKRPKVNN